MWLYDKFFSLFSKRQNTLTSEDIQLIDEIKNEYRDMIFNLKIKVNEEKIKESINWLYEFSDLKKPIIDIVESPEACQRLANEIYNKDLKEFKHYSFSLVGNVYNFLLSAYYDFFIKKGIINNKDFIHYKEIMQSGVWDCIQLEDRCIVSKMPVKINHNNFKLNDTDTELAIVFSDGYQISGKDFEIKAINYFKDHQTKYKNTKVITKSIRNDLNKFFK